MENYKLVLSDSSKSLLFPLHSGISGCQSPSGKITVCTHRCLTGISLYFFLLFRPLWQIAVNANSNMLLGIYFYFSFQPALQTFPVEFWE